MVKNVLIVGDLGAGTNIIKNLLLLGNYAWPLQTEQQIVVCLNQEGW